MNRLLLLLVLSFAACGPKTPVDPAAQAAAEEAARQAALKEQIRQLWNYEDPGVSRAKFKEAARIAPNDDVRDQLLTQEARAVGLLGSYDKGHEILDGIAEPAGRVRVRVLLERGRLHRSQGDSEAAMPLFRDAFELAKSVGDDALAVDAAHMSAISSDLEDAISWTRTGLGLARKSGDPEARRWIGPLTNNLGWSYHDAEKYEEALANWEESLAWHQEEQTGRGERIARWTVGRGLRSLGRYDEALEIQLQVLIDNKENREPTGFVHEELGEIYLSLGKETQAQRHFVKAYDALRLDAHLKATEPERIKRLKRLAGK